jgi:hypothetical protein
LVVQNQAWTALEGLQHGQQNEVSRVLDPYPCQVPLQSNPIWQCHVTKMICTIISACRISKSGDYRFRAMIQQQRLTDPVILPLVLPVLLLLVRLPYCFSCSGKYYTICGVFGDETTVLNHQR